MLHSELTELALAFLRGEKITHEQTKELAQQRFTLWDELLPEPDAENFCERFHEGGRQHRSFAPEGMEWLQVLRRTDCCGRLDTPDVYLLVKRNQIISG